MRTVKSGAPTGYCGLVVSAPAWDGTGCEFDSWQCRIYTPCSWSLRLLEFLRGSLGTYGLTQKLCLKNMVGSSSSEILVITQYLGVHVGFPKVGRVRNRATRAVVAHSMRQMRD